MYFFLALVINLVVLGLLFLYLSITWLAVVLGASLICWFFYYLWKRQNKIEQRVRERIAGQEIILPIEHIMFWAVESSGYSQASGMGYIVLTEEMLCFEMVLIDLSVEVPIDKIRGAEIVRRLKGVSPLVKMLRILFENEAGAQDSIAIGGKNKTLWKNTINDISTSVADT